MQPSSGLGADNLMSMILVSFCLHLTHQSVLSKKKLSIEQLKMAYNIQIQVNGNTAISGDIVDINLRILPLQKQQKTKSLTTYIKVNSISKLRHDFVSWVKKHLMRIHAVKDSLKTKLPSSQNPEIMMKVNKT